MAEREPSRARRATHLFLAVLVAAGYVQLTPRAPTRSEIADAMPSGLLTGAALLAEFGASGVGPGLLLRPYGVAVDGNGDVFATDGGTSIVEKFDASANALRSFGSSGSGVGQLDDPRGIAISPSGEVVVVDSGNARVQVFGPTGAFVRTLGGRGSADGQFQQPVGVAIDASNNVYVVDRLAGRVEELTSAGIFIRTFGFAGAGTNGALLNPEGVAVDAGGNVYVTDTGADRVEVYSPTGAYRAQWGGVGTAAGQFESPSAIAIDGAGNVFVTETGTTERVQQFDVAGTPLNVWGTGGGNSSQFDEPTGIAATSAGQVFVADRQNGRVQQFALQPRPAPTVPLIASVLLDNGLGGPGNGHAVADPSGNVFEFEWNQLNHPGSTICSLTKFTPTGTLLWQHATGGSRNSGDFCGAPLARPGVVGGPLDSITTDPNGDVYLREADLQRISVFGPDGTYLRQWLSPTYLDTANAFHTWWGPMVFDSSNHLWSDDIETNTMQEFTATGTLLTSWPIPGVVTPLTSNGTALAFDPVSGDLLVNAGDHFVALTTAGATDSTIAIPNQPIGASVTVDGLATDAAGHEIALVNAVSGVLGTRLPPILDVFDSTGQLVTTHVFDPGWAAPSLIAGDTSTDGAGTIFVFVELTTHIVHFGPVTPSPLPAPWFIRSFGELSTDGGFQAPQGLSVGPGGDVYVSTVGTVAPHSRVYRFTADGAFQTVFGGDCPVTFSGLCPPPSPGQFTPIAGAGATADDGQGTIYVADRWNSRVEVFDTDGTYRRQFTTGPNPLAIAIDGSGNLDVIVTNLDPTSSFNQRQIEQYLTDGTFVRRWTADVTGLQSLQPDMNWLSTDSDGNLLALIRESPEGQPMVGSVQRFSPTGTLISRWSLPDAAEAIATDRNGNVYTLATGAHRIEVSDKTGRPLGSWANPHFVTGQGSNDGLGVGPNGRLYVIDPVDHTVLMYGPPAFVMALHVIGPAATPAVSPAAFTVSAVDPKGATAVGYIGTIHFTTTDPAATLPADTTFTPSDAGTRQFNLSFHTAGPQTLTATDTNDGTLLGTWSTVVLTGPPGTGVQLPPGGTVSTAPPGSMPNPLIVHVQSPQGGIVDVDPSPGSSSLPGRYESLGVGAVIHAPPASANAPLQITFDLPMSALPNGTPANGVVALRDGIPIADCTTRPAVAADPDPCIASRTVAAAVLTISVLTTHASNWDFAIEGGIPITEAATASQQAIRVRPP